jgi:NTE family protein
LFDDDNENCHRALIFQGGGELGAYEAGAYQQIYRNVIQECTEDNLFDISACTSIGAINLAILVGYYLKDNNSWAGSVEKLLEFWEGLMCPTIANNLFNNNTVVSSTYTGSF